MKINKIKEIIDMIMDSNITELYLEIGNSKLVLKRSGKGALSDKNTDFKFICNINNLYSMKPRL